MNHLWQFRVINEKTRQTLQIDPVRESSDAEAQQHMKALYRQHGEPGVVIIGQKWLGSRWDTHQRKFKK